MIALCTSDFQCLQNPSKSIPQYLIPKRQAISNQASLSNSTLSSKVVLRNKQHHTQCRSWPVGIIQQQTSKNFQEKSGEQLLSTCLNQGLRSYPFQCMWEDGQGLDNKNAEGEDADKATSYSPTEMKPRHNFITLVWGVTSLVDNSHTHPANS